MSIRAELSLCHSSLQTNPLCIAGPPATSDESESEENAMIMMGVNGVCTRRGRRNGANFPFNIEPAFLLATLGHLLRMLTRHAQE